MANANPEAQLAIRLYRQQLLRTSRPNSARGPLEEYVKSGANQEGCAHDAGKLMSIARALHRLDERECNGDLDKRGKAREARLSQAALDLLTGYGLKAQRNGDPRGFSLYIHFGDDSYNNWGGADRGWGI